MNVIFPQAIENSFSLNCDFLKKNKVFAITALINVILLSLSIIALCFGIQLGCVLTTAIGGILLTITLISSALLLSWVIKNKLFLYKTPQKKEQASQTDFLFKEPSSKASPLSFLKQDLITIKKQPFILFSSKKDLKNIIDASIAKNWRPCLDQKQHLRYLYITNPIGLFLSIRRGSLLTSHSASSQRNYSIVVDMNNFHHQEYSTLLSLIPNDYVQDMLQTPHNSLVHIPNLHYESYPSLSHVICIKSLYDLHFEKTPSPQEKQEALLNQLKMPYIKILNSAIQLRTHTLQISPFEIPFKMDEEIKKDLNKIALLQAIDDVTSENKSMDVLQEIILVFNSTTLS